jgi:hypothetical protein
VETEYQNIREMWTSMKTLGDRYKPLWDDISNYAAISVEPDYLWNNNQNKSQQRDEYVDDPTSALSVNQAGDYLIGIMWGSGEEVFDLIPSRYVLEFAESSDVEEWFKFATAQALYHMNHSESGFHTALSAYAYDQVSFGTSGLGCFVNDDFRNQLADNALTFRNYGIDNTRIAEGKNGIPETVGCSYHWKTSRIVGEFAMTNGVIDGKKFAKLPKSVRECYNSNKLNEEFDIVFIVYPRMDYNPTKIGKRGTRYRGVWFMDDKDSNNFFYEEDFATKPIAMARQMKVRGETYGRSSGTLLLSSIKSVNFMVSTVIEILEKMANPSLGMFNNAIFGDNVLDTSANGITVFNTALMSGQKDPLFPLYDVGDPSGIINFLIPYLNDKITTGFKVDALLDFNNSKDMTATESLQRYNIRGKSISGMLRQQKIEGLEPVIKRSVSLLMSLGELGVNPAQDKERAKALFERGKNNRVIPEAVLEVIKSGKAWFEIKYNNEMEKLMRTEVVQNLLTVIQSITAIAALQPDIIQAVNWYKLLKDINDNLDYNNQILWSESEFKENIARAAEARATAMQLQAGQAGASIEKDMAQANKTNIEAKNIG